MLFLICFLLFFVLPGTLDFQCMVIVVFSLELYTVYQYLYKKGFVAAQ